MSRMFAKSHEWVEFDGDTATVGISDFAQEELGDVVFIQLLEVGTELEIEDTLAEIESVKAVSEAYSPVSGTVIEVNQDVIDNPALINEDSYAAWFVKVKYKDCVELLTEEEYKDTL